MVCIIPDLVIGCYWGGLPKMDQNGSFLVKPVVETKDHSDLLHSGTVE